MSNTSNLTTTSGKTSFVILAQVAGREFSPSLQHHGTIPCFTDGESGATIVVIKHAKMTFATETWQYQKTCCISLSTRPRQPVLALVPGCPRPGGHRASVAWSVCDRAHTLYLRHRLEPSPRSPHLSHATLDDGTQDNHQATLQARKRSPAGLQRCELRASTLTPRRALGCLDVLRGS